MKQIAGVSSAQLIHSKLHEFLIKFPSGLKQKGKKIINRVYRVKAHFQLC